MWLRGLIWLFPIRFNFTWCVRFDVSWFVLSFELIEFDLTAFHSTLVGLMMVDSIHCDWVVFKSIWGSSFYVIWLDVGLNWLHWMDSIWFGFTTCGSIGCHSICFYLVGFTCRVSLAWASDCFRVPGLTLFGDQADATCMELASILHFMSLHASLQRP